jgi:hypothetical protein
VEADHAMRLRRHGHDRSQQREDLGTVPTLPAASRFHRERARLVVTQAGVRPRNHPKWLKPLRERFADKFCPEPNTGYWLWTGHCDENGYGLVNVAGKNYKAHRVAFYLAYGRWPTPCALHRCDNPACVNPAHLFEGTKRDNTNDMLAKGRGFEPPNAALGRSRTSCPRGHAYDESNTRRHAGRRICRTCERLRMRANRAKARP